MDADGKFVSLAVETSCRTGAVALGVGDELAARTDFDASRRAAAQVIGFLDELIKPRGLTPADVDAIIVSQGPGSFTGTRVGVTVARTFAQAIENAKCIGVHTPRVVAENIEGSEGDKCFVVLDARAGNLYVSGYEFSGGKWQAVGDSYVASAVEFDKSLTCPVTLTGEGLGYCEIKNPNATIADESLWLPRVESLWKLGYEKAMAGDFVDFHQLLPIYTGKSQAEQNWESNQK